MSGHRIAPLLGIRAEYACIVLTYLCGCAPSLFHGSDRLNQIACCFGLSENRAEKFGIIITDAYKRYSHPSCFMCSCCLISHRDYIVHDAPLYANGEPAQNPFHWPL